MTLPLAEEVAQDAFVAVHRRWHSIDQDRLAAYLRRSVVNGARSALRRRGVEERYLRSQSQVHLTLVADSAESTVLARAGSEQLIEMLRDLPRRQREVLVLRYYLDLSEREIAESLAISVGSVKSHASRALNALRTRLTEQENVEKR